MNLLLTYLCRNCHLRNITTHQLGGSSAHSIGYFEFIGLNTHWLFEVDGLLSTTRGLKDLEEKRKQNNIISLYCFLSVQYLNYISVFQLIALN